MADDELVGTLHQALEGECGDRGRRRSQERRSRRPSNYSGSERRRAADRRVLNERRSGGDRRSGGERRGNVDRRYAFRRQEDQLAFQKRVEEGDLTLEEIDFVRAVDQYKRKFNRPFPTWSEILAIVKELGYTKDSLT